MCRRRCSPAFTARSSACHLGRIVWRSTVNRPFRVFARWAKRIAFVRGGDKDETGKPKPAQIAMLPLAGGEAWIITDLPKGAAEPVWSPDGRWLLDSAEKQGRTPLVRVDAQSGAVTEITRGDQAVLDFCMTEDAHAIVALISTPVMIGDLFTVAANGAETRITDFNGGFWS